MYKHIGQRVCALLVCMAVSLGSEAQSTFHLRFTDMSTGIRVIPGSVILTQREDNKIVQILPAAEIAGNGTVMVPVPDGTYDIIVAAAGYKPIATWFKMEHQELKVNIKLDRERPVRELSHEHIAGMHTKDAMVVTGFVVDVRSGMPMAGVTVSSADKAVSAVTDTNGYYVLHLPLAQNAQGVEARGTLIFSKRGYTTEICQRFDMWGNGDMILPIKMQPGNGSHAAAVIDKRELHRDIIEP